MNLLINYLPHLGPEPGQGPGGLLEMHTERHRLWGLQLPHPNTDRGKTYRPGQDPGKGPEQKLEDSCRSLQEHPNQVPRDRDLGPSVGPISQQEVGRLRSPATTATSPDRIRPRDPQSPSSPHYHRGVQQALQKVPGKEERSRTTAQAWPTKPNRSRTSRGYGDQVGKPAVENRGEEGKEAYH